ncbi:MAG: DUF2272 domain-containing protein [Xanthomonadales bacterium]|nr:DUF2272 domain-containing protein [Xanthomonadales bacterium]
MRLSSRGLSLVVFAALALSARAGASVRPCEFHDGPRQPTGLRLRIAEAACREHADWYAPFINAEGRVGWQDGRVPMEAEGGAERLASGTPPWQRVAEYWRRTPALDGLRRANGAKECEALSGAWQDSAACRAFILDHPWSAAFVSYVMKRAGVEDFASSAEHIVYMRDAYASTSPRRRYRLVAPWRERPEVGDLLCYSREARVADYRGLVAFFDQGGGSLKTHCDIVVGVDLDGDSKLYTIGGNLMQTVMMRKLPLNASGRFVPPAATADDAPCRMNEERACSLNAKAWVALLKLRD